MPSSATALDTAEASAAVSPGAVPPTVPLPMRSHPMLLSFEPRLGSPSGDGDDVPALGGGGLAGGVVVGVVVGVDPDWALVLPLAPVTPLLPLGGEVAGRVVVGSGRDGRAGNGRPRALAALATAPVMVGRRELS